MSLGLAELAQRRRQAHESGPLQYGMESLQEPDATKREAMWAAVDKRVMEEAVILPGLWAKSLLLRGKGVTNVYINDAFSMYDYLNMGVQ